MYRHPLQAAICFLWSQSVKHVCYFINTRQPAPRLGFSLTVQPSMGHAIGYLKGPAMF